MSASTAKASRREVRKAFGPAALDAIGGHDHQLRVMGEHLNTLTDVQAQFQVVLTAHRQELTDLHTRAAAAHHRIVALETLLGSSFWSRVKYLACGASFS